MALNDAGYFLPSRTVLYTGAVDATPPTSAQLDAPPGFTILGHVGDETGDGNVAFTREGGDVTTKGSMTKKAIRQVVEPVVSGIDADVTQWTREALSLYHGTTGGVSTTEMSIEGDSDGTATEGSVLVVWEDGTARVGLYAPRGSWTGRDNIETASIEDAVRIPLHAGFLDSETLVGPNGKPLRFKWISPTLLATS